MVQTIIEKDQQQINAKGQDGQPPLHYCAWSDKQLIEKVELLIQRGANVNEPDNSGCNVLYYAADNEKLELVKLLVERT